MVPPADLERQAHDFADDLTRLLNGTVTNGIRISSLLVGDRCNVGYRIGKSNPVESRPIPLKLLRPPRAYLVVFKEFRLDDERIHLTDARSLFALYAGPDPNGEIVRYDYNRDITNYAEAHVHISGTSESYDELCERAGLERTGLTRRHFPVGGRRFRPCLEDLIEFLIREGMVEHQDGWKDVLDEHRNRFHAIQLQAAVRRNEKVAAQQLEATGWTCTPPQET